MLEGTVVSLAVGTILGFLTGLGTGGGSLLMLWLTLVLHMEPVQARVINLMFFLPAALISTIFHWKQGRVPFKKLLLPALAGCIGAALFAIWGQKMNTESLQKLFGVLLLLTGVRELFYRPRNAK
jgi:uncharacterized membrane protein YfcA